MPSGKQIGDRIWFERDSSDLRIEINQRVERWKEILLGLWLVGWLFCGAVFVYYMNSSEFESQRVFLIVTLGFWAFFMFRILRVFFWRLVGKEMIMIKEGVLTIRNKLGPFGKLQTFNLQHVKNFGLVKYNERNFMQFMDRSFWVMGGETMGFNYMGKKFQFGKQLEEKEVRALSFVVEKALRQFSR